MKVMILPSVDGQDYAHAVVFADSVDDEVVFEAVRIALATAKVAAGDSWEWEQHILPALEGVNCIVLPTQVVTGPTWDVG